MKNIPSITALAILAVVLIASCAKNNENPGARDERADEPEIEMIASIESQAGNIGRSIVDLAAVRNALQSLAASSQGTDTAGLKSADESLGKRIDGLTGFVEGDLKCRDNAQWLEATLATLGQYEATCATVAAIEAKFGAADGKLSKEIGTCTGSLASWINVQFSGSYTAALADATVSDLKARMASAEGVSREAVDSINAELATAGKDVDAAMATVSGTYRTAIDSTIRLFDGRMTKGIQDGLTKANDEAESATAKIAVIEAKVDELVGRVSDLEHRVQSITLIPVFDDGSIAIEEDTLLSIDCIINPAEAVKSLKTEDFTLLLSQFYSDEVTVDTVFSSKIVSFEPGADVPGLLTVKYDISDYLEGLDGIYFSAALKVSTGKLYSTSEYRNVVNSVAPSAVDDDRTEVYYQMARLIGSKQPGKKYNPYRVLFNMCGDDVVASGKFDANDPITRLNTFSYDASNEIVVTCYNNFYEAIDVCNKFIYKYLEDDYSLKDNTFIPRDFRSAFDQYVAEARVLRAWLHFTLATGWHNPPLVTEYPAPESLVNCPYDEMLKWCEEELTDVIDGGGLKTRSEVPATIVSKNFACAVLGKVYMFEHSVFQTEIETVPGTALLRKAQDCFDCVDRNQCKLSDYYSENFIPDGNGNEEKLFELDMERFTDPACGREPVSGMETTLWSVGSGDAFIADPWAASDYVRGDWKCCYSKTLVDEFVKGDSRFPVSLFYSLFHPDPEKCFYSSQELDDINEKWKDARFGIKEDGLYGFCDMTSDKLFVKQSYLNADGKNKTNFTIMRYAEVLLLCAEAKLLQGDEAGALNSFNDVQQRSGLASLNSFFVVDANTYAQKLDVIGNGKMIELWMEGCRWPDIIRWKGMKAATGSINTLKNAGKNAPILYDTYTRAHQPDDESFEREVWIDPTSWKTPERLYIIRSNKAVDALGAANVGFKEGKHEYFPYPAEAISKGLIQNPGW